MTLSISRSVLGAVEATAGSSAKEVCGLLLRDGVGVAALPCRNVHPASDAHFEIDPAALLAAHRAARAGGPAIVGHYHSHPGGNASPSAADAANAVPDGSIWLIIGREESRAWHAVHDGAVHGRFDPVELVVTPPCARVAPSS